METTLDSKEHIMMGKQAGEADEAAEN